MAYLTLACKPKALQMGGGSWLRAPTNLSYDSFQQMRCKATERSIITLDATHEPRPLSQVPQCMSMLFDEELHTRAASKVTGQMASQQETRPRNEM